MPNSYNSTGYKMIDSIKIKNFRCFENAELKKCNRVNIVVGENGVGKTALLEAIFLTLASSPEIALRFRVFRGMESNIVSGAPKGIEQALWSDLFYRYDDEKVISVDLQGSGPEARSLNIYSGDESHTFLKSKEGEFSEERTSGIKFRWKDHTGKERISEPTITDKGIEMKGTGEDLPNFFYFASSYVVNSREIAERFSILSRANKEKEFIEILTKEFSWIKNLSIQSVGGIPVIYADLEGITEKIPLNNVSGGINRMVGIALTIASRPKSVVVVDEIENGIYYKHNKAWWRNLLFFAKKYDCQLFLSTHSQEWLEALVEITDEKADDFSLCRIERTSSGPDIKQFNGKQMSAAIKVGEVR